MTAPTPSLGFLVRETARLMQRRFDGFIESAGAGAGITQAQWITLATVHKQEGLTQADLAAKLGLEAISVCRMVDRLESAGLIERHADPADRRVRRLYLTEPARPAMERMRAIAVGIFDEMLAGFSADETATLLTLLDRVRANLVEVLPTVSASPEEPPSSTPARPVPVMEPASNG